ncbi:calmodulin-regulated spectrin-associated protein [Mytilus galloprovincialis]|uniref:Calmodulin-regulated spectrin-associated protein n=1 Tax=Mytilus galloprovincialis TaxID=29158 RepID=A0A8B6HAQ6_MYTGA|nr:calmodulin-regulated spectrin-associated protein [Mytilus galloprovincialis]
MDNSDEVIEIVPMDEYDSQKAKLQASLAWILEKSYKGEVPAEFKPPFYETSEGQLHVKPRLANLMVTSELYCQACRNMFGNVHSQWQGHWSIIQVLSRKGIYVVEPDETEVTETILMKNAPFQQNAHLTLIDCLMMAYISETVSVERVVQAVRRFAVFNASSELPSDTENAVDFWFNKVCSTVQSKEQKGSQVLEGQSKMKVRIVSRSGDSSLDMPFIEEFLQDIGDGCCLAVLVHFYCPEHLKLTDICLKSNLGIADSLYNLSLVKKFCGEHLPSNCFHLSYEDFLYTHNNLKQNLYALVADLFHWFEINPAPCVRSPSREDSASRPSTAKHITSNMVLNVPISNVTKQSFKKCSMDDSGLHSPQSGAVQLHPHKPLLPKRQMRSEEREHPPVTQSVRGGRRSLSLSSAKERDVIQETMLAWQDRSSNNDDDEATKSTSSNLLANVSIDTEMMDSFSDDVIGSIDIGDDTNPTPPPTLTHPSDQQRETTASNLHNQDHPDYMEVQSVTSGVSRMTDRSGFDDVRTQNGLYSDTSMNNSNIKSGSHSVEPLLTARLKPAKEKTNNHSKDQERSHIINKKSPTRKEPELISRDLRSPTRSKGKSTDSACSFSLSEDSSVTDSVTPLPDDMLSDSETSQQKPLDRPIFSAFSIPGNVSERAVDKSSDSVKLSYTIQSQVYTPETARAAGIPIVTDSSDRSSLVHSEGKTSVSREGSVCSRSSGDFSDHESHKIHKDHKIKESEDVKTPTNISFKKPEMLIIKTGDDIKPNTEKKIMTTNFAEIRRLKQGLGKVDNSGLVFMQHGQEPKSGENKKSSFNNSSNGARSEKKTSFALSNNHTTWQQTLQNASPSGESAQGSAEPPVPSELLQIKMKLEEKRKLIEKKKQRNEVQQQRLRQKLGKTAFLHVLKKPGDTENGILEEEARSSSSGSFEDLAGAQRQDISTERKPQYTQKEHSPSLARAGPDEYDSASGMSQRPFSREGIQQTIENVRKKWFKDDGEVVTQAYAEKPETPDSPPPFDGRLAEKHLPKPTADYNTSLDKFNRNLSDLQIEINRLSLQQEQIKQSRGLPPQQQRNVQQRLPNTSVPMTTQHHMTRGPEISYNPQSMQPQQVPVGPVVPSQNQYMPATGAGLNQYHPATSTGHNQYVPPYNGYQQVFSPSCPYPPAQPQAFGQSPPYPVPPQHGAGPMTSSPHTHGMVPAFSPMGPGIPTPGLQHSAVPSSHVGAQMYHPPLAQPMTNYQPVTSTVTNIHSNDNSVPNSYHSQTPVSGQYQNFSQTPSRVTTDTSLTQVSSLSDTSQTNAQGHLESVISNDLSGVSSSHTGENDLTSKNEFFVSFNESTPKAKPILGKNRLKADSVSAVQEQVNSNQNRSELDSTSHTQDVSQGSDASQNASGQNVSGIGFVIGEDETSINQDEAEEIQKKKEKLIQLQQKRKEEQEKKRQYKEIEMSRRKDQERVKQEQSDQRKLEEKLRREEIFRQYQEKKHKEDEETRPVVKRERSFRQKSRPQSMFVKPNKPAHKEPLHTSQEDLTAGRRYPPRSNTFHHGKMRKAVSCNQLTTSAEGKSLAFGGMTHRKRPPSPDLHGRGKMSASGSSEAGSMSGSDYSGPKLYVKPSTKSNKSIINNAISHCCLAGSVNTTMKNTVLEVLEGSEAHHFMILFRDHSCQYRSLYMYYTDTDFMIKLHGVGPNRITNSMIEKFYKYNSGGKKFTQVVSTKHLSVSIDAVVIHNSLWKTHKMAAKNK